jgi:hypothetical protein
VLLILGHFLSGVGAGTWLFSLWLGYRPGLVLAVGAMAAAALAHLFFLGHPERFWRMFHARTSWIARGFADAGGPVLIQYPRARSTRFRSGAPLRWRRRFSANSSAHLSS